ncbi:MAG: hypothetical protein JW784_06895 [Candidatus Cloacimonetes bacterium]|nr:hypothetical protein [Candidatus Cloacimonadota bacterium]
MKFVFNRLNSLLLIVALVLTIAGYIIMGTGDKTISPILLIIAYAVIFPMAIMAGSRKKS